MKGIGRTILSVLEIVIFFVNVVLSLIVILNLLLLISTKLLNNDYPVLLDYTYFIVKDTDASLNLDDGDLLIVDIKKEYEVGNIVMFKNKDNLSLGNINIREEASSVVVNSSEKIIVSNEDIIGTATKKVPKLGFLLDKILNNGVLLVSVVILVITSIIQSLVNKKIKKVKEVKPEVFNQKLY